MGLAEPRFLGKGRFSPYQPATGWFEDSAAIRHRTACSQRTGGYGIEKSTADCSPAPAQSEAEIRTFRHDFGYSSGELDESLAVQSPRQSRTRARKMSKRMSNEQQDLWIDALQYLANLGKAHLQDIRFGAYKTRNPE